MTHSADVARILAAANWSPSRPRDIHPHVQSLESEGYFVFDCVQEFLRVYCGLKVFRGMLDGGDDPWELILINLDNEILCIWPEWCHCFSKVVGSRLCPIGTCGGKYFALLMSEAGRVYKGGDSNLYFVADNGFEAIEAILTGKDLVEVDVDVGIPECSWFRSGYLRKAAQGLTPDESTRELLRMDGIEMDEEPPTLPPPSK